MTDKKLRQIAIGKDAWLESGSVTVFARVPELFAITKSSVPAGQGALPFRV